MKIVDPIFSKSLRIMLMTMIARMVLKKNMTVKIDMMVAQVRESNTACQAGDFEKAVGLYTEAIALDKCNHILYSNRLDYS